jgi:hypothetical protein
LEKANGIPSREATQFWKEGLDNEAAREAHECKTPAEVKEVARKLYWMEADRKRSEVEFARSGRIPGETILQTKKRYISTLIFKTAIKDDVKREDKIKEDSQLFQIKEEKKQAKKNRAKKGETKKGNSKKGKRKFFCKNHPNSNTHNNEDCQMERQRQGTKREREDREQQPNKAAKFTCFNCVGHRARDCPTPINEGNSKYPVLTCDTGIIMVNCMINGHRTRIEVDLGCKCVLINSNFHNKTTQGKPRLQASNIALSGASNEAISVLGDKYTTWDMEDLSICRSKESLEDQTYTVTENSKEETVWKIYKIGANKWKVPTTVAQGLAADVILGASAFKAMGVVINGPKEIFTICGKTVT